MWHWMGSIAIFQGEEMRRKQLTITCPYDQGEELFGRLVELRDNRYWNISKFCREAITEKLERMELLR